MVLFVRVLAPDKRKCVCEYKRELDGRGVCLLALFLLICENDWSESRSQECLITVMSAWAKMAGITFTPLFEEE